MSFTDLTGRHSLTTYGTPNQIASGGYWGNGFTQFDGTSALQVNGNPNDWDFGTGDFNVSVDFYIWPENHLAYGPSSPHIRLLSATQGGDSDSWTLANALSSIQDLWFENDPPGAFEYVMGDVNYTSLAAGWHTYSIDRASGIVRSRIDGVLKQTRSDSTQVVAGAVILNVAAYIASDADFRTKCDLANLRITKGASREGLPFTQPKAGAENDPLWSNVVLFLSMATDSPTTVVGITSMTGDTAPVGDWVTSDGSAGRTVVGTLSAPIAAGESVQVSFDDGATWVTATATGLAWSAVDPTAHATSWYILAKVSNVAGDGPITTRAVTYTPVAPRVSPAPPAVISQYANSPTLYQILENLTFDLDITWDIGQFYDAVLNLNTARGFGLDIWGRIVGVNRTITIPTEGGFFGFGEASPGANPFDSAPFYDGAQSVSDTYLLTDQAYRQLLLVKAAANLSALNAPALNALLRALFPDRGRCYVLDLGGMAFQYTFEFVLTAAEMNVLTQSGVIPRPAGVSVTIVTI